MIISKALFLRGLYAKVKAVMKRYGQSVNNEYSDGWLTVDFQARNPRYIYYGIGSWL